MQKKKYKIPKLPWFYIDGPTWFFYDPPYQLFGLLWRFHKTDKDDIISIPHGDCIDSKKKYQLDPYTGQIYYKKSVIGSITRSEFKRLWKDEKFLVYVHEARKYYLENHSSNSLPDIPELRRKKSFLHYADVEEYEISLTSVVQKEFI